MTLQTFVVSCCSALHHSLTAVLSMRPVRFLNIPFKMDARAHTHTEVPIRSVRTMSHPVSQHYQNLFQIAKSRQ